MLGEVLVLCWGGMAGRKGEKGKGCWVLGVGYMYE